MNRFNQNPLKNLRHVKEVQPPKTGRARRRETGEPTPISLREVQTRFGPEFEARNLQLIAMDLGAPEGDASAMVTLDSMSQMVSMEINRRLSGNDTRAEQDARMEHMVRAVMLGTPPPVFVFGPGVQERARQAASGGAPFEVRSEDRVQFGDSPTMRQADFIISAGQRAGRNTLRSFDLETYSQEPYFPVEITDRHVHRRMAREDPDMPRISLNVQDRMSASLSAMAARTSGLSAAIQATGRAMRRIPFDNRLTRNYPIQAAADEMLRMEFTAAERRIAEQAASPGPLRMDELSSLLPQETIDSFIDAIINVPRRPSFMDAFRRADGKAKMKAAEPPHPDAGKVINRPRRSFAGVMIEEVRNADGSVSRRPRTTDPK